MYAVQTIVCGAGDASATPQNGNIRGAAASGTNLAGKTLYIDVPTGTGTGAEGHIVVRTAPATSSGTAAHALVSTIDVSNTGITINSAITLNASLTVNNNIATSSGTMTCDGNFTVNGTISGTGVKDAALSSDQSFSNNTTMANVTGLSFAIGASQTWTAEFDLWVTTSGTSAGIKFQLSGPASPTAVVFTAWTFFVGTSAITSSTVTAFSSPLVAAGQAGVTTMPVRCVLTVINGGNSGTVQLQAASNAASNSTCSVLTGSRLHARRIT